MKSATPHLQAARVIAACPLKELDVGFVKLSTGHNCTLSIPLDLAHLEARQTNRSRNDEEHDQLELRDKRISPPAERPRQNPRE